MLPTEAAKDEFVYSVPVYYIQWKIALQFSTDDQHFVYTHFAREVPWDIFQTTVQRRPDISYPRIVVVVTPYDVVLHNRYEQLKQPDYFEASKNLFSASSKLITFQIAFKY